MFAPPNLDDEETGAILYVERGVQALMSNSDDALGKCNATPLKEGTESSLAFNRSPFRDFLSALAVSHDKMGREAKSDEKRNSVKPYDGQD